MQVLRKQLNVPFVVCRPFRLHLSICTFAKSTNSICMLCAFPKIFSIVEPFVCSRALRLWSLCQPGKKYCCCRDRPRSYDVPVTMDGSLAFPVRFEIAEPGKFPPQAVTSCLLAVTDAFERSYSTFWPFSFSLNPYSTMLIRATYSARRSSLWRSYWPSVVPLPERIFFLVS